MLKGITVKFKQRQDEGVFEEEVLDLKLVSDTLALGIDLREKELVHLIVVVAFSYPALDSLGLGV